MTLLYNGILYTKKKCFQIYVIWVKYVYETIRLYFKSNYFQNLMLYGSTTQTNQPTELSISNLYFDFLKIYFGCHLTCCINSQEISRYLWSNIWFNTVREWVSVYVRVYSLIVCRLRAKNRVSLTNKLDSFERNPQRRR